MQDSIPGTRTSEWRRQTCICFRRQHISCLFSSHSLLFLFNRNWAFKSTPHSFLAWQPPFPPRPPCNSRKSSHCCWTWRFTKDSVNYLRPVSYENIVDLPEKCLHSKKKKKKDNLMMPLLCFCCVCCYDVWMCPLHWQRPFCCSCEDGAMWQMVERRNWKPSHCINWLFFFFFGVLGLGCRLRFSPAAVVGAPLWLRCAGLSLQSCSCFQARALRRADFSTYGRWAQWWRPWALDHRLSSRIAQVWLLRGMWGFSGSELQLTSPALAGGFLTTDPPRKPLQLTVRPLPIYHMHLSRLQAIYQIHFLTN